MAGARQYGNRVPAMRLLISFALVFSLAGCSPSETQEDRLARAESLSDVVVAVTHTVPAQAYAIADTRYLAVITESTSVTRDYPLLQTKNLMPVLLDRYPDIDRFFFAWSKDGSQFLKIQFERNDVQNVNWQHLRVRAGEVQKYSSMYWVVPALR